MLNIVAVMGRLVADPEMRQTTTGKSVSSFRIACDRGWKDANGQNLVDWLDCQVWGKTAEFVCKHFQKGSMIALNGRIQSRHYQDKNGNNRTAVEIVAQNVYFAGNKNAAPKEDLGHPAAQQAPAPSYSTGTNDDFALIEDDGDLPF